MDVCGGPIDRASQIGFSFGQCSIMLLSYWAEFWDAHVIMQFVATLESFQIISWALQESVVYDFSSNFRLFLCVLPIFLFSSILTNLPLTTNVAPTHAYIARLCLNTMTFDVIKHQCHTTQNHYLSNAILVTLFKLTLCCMILPCWKLEEAKDKCNESHTGKSQPLPQESYAVNFN